MMAKLRRKAASITRRFDPLILTASLLAPSVSPFGGQKFCLQFVEAPGVRKESAKNRRILKCICMRYLVRARGKPGFEKDLLNAIERETLGEGSVAEGEYLRNMKDARLCGDGTARWVEVCYCPTPLQEERPYWEEYFDLTKVQDAHDRRKCRDENGSEPWACGDCDCTARLENKLKCTGQSFLATLRDQTQK